jgi:DNA-binding transcriptional MerR regulator
MMNLPVLWKVKTERTGGGHVLIGELAEATGTTATTLRFYESSGLLPPPQRTPGGYRDYPASAVARLDFIRRGRAVGLTLVQIRDILDIREGGEAPCSHVRELLARRLNELDRQIADLLALRQTVQTLHDAAATTDPQDCPADRICRYI